MLIWKFVEYYMSTKHIQTDHKTHGWAKAPWVTWLGKGSRSEMTGQELQVWHAWAIALRRWNLEFRREVLLEWNDRASDQEVTGLGKCSRSDMTGQELKKCHDWARAPGVTWLCTFSLFYRYLALELLSFCAFLNFHVFDLLLHRSFFLFYTFLIFSTIVFLSSLDCVAFGCRRFQHQTCNVFIVSLI